jgi:hypothetical protein
MIFGTTAISTDFVEVEVDEDLGFGHQPSNTPKDSKTHLVVVVVVVTVEVHGFVVYEVLVTELVAGTVTVTTVV